MAERKKYTDDERGAVLRALTVNNGNVKRTARELNMPPATVKSWKKEWEREGIPDAVKEAAAEDMDAFISDATRARDLALRQWEDKVNQGEVAARDLMTGVGVLTDKINLARGLTRKEEKPALDPAVVRELARGVVEGAVSAARKREEEIVEAEYEEIEQPALKRGTS